LLSNGASTRPSAVMNGARTWWAPVSDPGVDVGRDPLDQRRALDLGGDEGVNGWSPVGADLGAGCGEV
jgi:hypothetical protein